VACPLMKSAYKLCCIIFSNENGVQSGGGGDEWTILKTSV
jgi:hypothetical protein